ncbi:MAG TPA: DUF4058 family protein [Pirellulales bacterium]|nr:DUF4058 family protein [Pirellulales bacterium]
MAVHDWNRVKAGTFHDFHGSWIVHLKETLNAGLLPDGYYALSEQHADRAIADVLTLEEDDARRFTVESGAVAVAETPPRVSQKMVASENAAYRSLRRTLAIRHSSQHRLVAAIELLSPANKDRSQNVQDFVEKVLAMLRAGCHLLVIDLLPPGPHDPHGVHGAIWEYFDPQDYEPPAGKPLTLAAYQAGEMPEAYLEPTAVGSDLPSMPLFLQAGWYVDVPLETTYQMAYRGVPAYWRRVLEGTQRRN